MKRLIWIPLILTFIIAAQMAECKQLTGHWLRRRYKTLKVNYVKYFDPSDSDHSDPKTLLQADEVASQEIRTYAGFLRLSKRVETPKITMMHFDPPLTLKNGQKVDCSCKLTRVIDHEVPLADLIYNGQWKK